MHQDLLEEIMEEETQRDPNFLALVDAALQRRQLLHQLASNRRDAGLSQTVVAAKMETSQSQLVRLENGGADPKLSTLQRYAAALGFRVELQLVPQHYARQPIDGDHHAERMQATV